MCSSAEQIGGRARPERGNGNGGALGCLILVLALSAVGAARGQAPQLLEKYKCYYCHADKEAKTGPAFVDIAAASKGNAHAASALVAAIRKGSHGSGPWHMPPHPEVSEADAKAMVRYILSLQK